MEISVGNKKHIFVFNTDAGVMTVGTDDLFELSNQEWFTSFLGVTSKSIVRKPVKQVAKEIPVGYSETDVDAIVAKETRALRAQLNEAVRIGQGYEEELQRVAEQKEAQPPLPELPPEEEVKVVAQEMEQEMKAHQEHLDKQPSRPDIRADVPNAGQRDVMAITPNNMTEQIWVTMSEEQKQAYGQKYGM